jgi:hypothetical protein
MHLDYETEISRNEEIQGWTQYKKFRQNMALNNTISGALTAVNTEIVVFQLRCCVLLSG